MLIDHRLKIKPRSYSPLTQIRILHNPMLLAKYDRASQQALLRSTNNHLLQRTPTRSLNDV
ncbi:MAG: hypothetical protein KME18_16710 [Phormidium tanganyikae FI6-MK23]|nr:hypothetical protein [Phormidium tanganyikae FI6-MK23]